MMTKATGSTASDAVLARVGEDFGRYRAELDALLRIPSISTDPAFAPEVRRCAAALVAELGRLGLAAERIDTAGHPLVYGEWRGAPGKPTLLLYGHYDVQPVEPLADWSSPPFSPTEVDGHVVARGATDDKGQLFTHLKAIDAWMNVHGALPVNLKVLLEGEEESSGEALECFVRADAGRRLACDGVLISDGDMLGPDQPSLVVGIRGIAGFELRVRGAERDLHSGSYGGAVANPAAVLATLVGSLVDPGSGRVRIEGFYDQVRELTERERSGFATLPFDAAAWLADVGLEGGHGEVGFSVLERLWARPTCEVNGLWGGYSGGGVKTIVPARAGAKITCRLVPDQDPERIVALARRHLERILEQQPIPGIRLEIESQAGAAPYLADATGPVFVAASEALSTVWGRPAVLVRDGGSLPIVSTFAEVLGAPVVLMGFGLPTDRPHAADERFSLAAFRRGVETGVRFLERLAAVAG